MTPITIDTHDILRQAKLSHQIPQLIQAIVSERIVLKMAAEKGITATTEELQQTADVLRVQNQLHRAQDTWEWLQKHHLSIDDFESWVQSYVISLKLSQHLFGDKVDAFFVEHQLDYTKAVLYEVILEDEDLAFELFYAVQEGEMTFHDMAHQYIPDRESRRKGGYRGAINRFEMKPEVATAVFSAHPPQLLAPIVTSHGVHLVLVEEVIEAKLDTILRQGILARLFSEWLNRQVEQVMPMIKIEDKSAEVVRSS
jgi:parvulin-like peptidyl-prolyl isomerase